MPKFVRTGGMIVLASLMLLFGYLIAAAGYQTLRKWPSISAAYAAYGMLWVVTGPAMLGSGLWVLGCLGRNRIPFWIGGVAALCSNIASGGGLILGGLTAMVFTHGAAERRR